MDSVRSPLAYPPVANAATSSERTRDAHINMIAPKASVAILFTFRSPRGSSQDLCADRIGSWHSALSHLHLRSERTRRHAPAVAREEARSLCSNTAVPAIFG